MTKTPDLQPETSPDLPRRRWRQVLHAAVRLGLLLAVLGFCFCHIARHWDAVASRDWQAHPILISVSLLILVGTIVFRGLLLAFLVRAAGFRVGLWKTTAGFMVAHMGAYIPGKVWTIMGQGFLLVRDGVPLPTASALALLAQVMAMVAAALVALLVAPLFLGPELGWCLPVIVVVVGVATIGLHPRFYFGGINLLLRLAGRQPLRIELPPRQVLKLLLLNAGYWVPYGVALGLFVMAFEPVPWSDVPAMTGVMSFASIAGLVAIFAPGGIGVREGLLMLILPRLISPEAAIVVSVATRVWQTVADLCSALLGLAFLRLGRSWPQR